MDEKVTIMVVDDEPSVLESFKMILSIKDYEVFTFPNGDSTLKSIQPGKFQIAFVDMRIPMAEGSGLDMEGGLKILKGIKDLDPLIEVVIVTAYATDANHANAITLGAFEYLSKPFLMEEIYELVERGLRRRRERVTKKSGPSVPPSSIH